MSRVAIIGGGSWGTALALIAANNCHHVSVWTRDPIVVEEINLFHRNPNYLSEIEIPSNVCADSDIRLVVSGADRIVLAVPSQTLRESLARLAGLIEPEAIIVNAAKGIESGTGLRASEIFKQEIPESSSLGFVCLSGPSFAREAALGHPTVLVAASDRLESARRIQNELSSTSFRIYASNDLAGVEICGAVKNIMAIAAGMAAGLNLGDNSIAALITRGLAEMSRFASHFGARIETMMGLAGLGDLVLTCKGKLSRNRFVGEELGKGRALEDILKGMTEVAEGVETTAAVKQTAERMGVEMPITNAVYSVLYERQTPLDAIDALMSRPLRDEG